MSCHASMEVFKTLRRCQKNIGAISKELILVKFGSIGASKRIVKDINDDIK